MNQAADWAIMRQVVFGAENLEITSKELRENLGLTPGFADPILEDIGLADETIRVGAEAHLEVVAPLNESASINGWITKGGGGGGYALSIQVPDLAPRLAAAEKLGVRTVAAVEVYGRNIVQLHPGDLGLLVELDEIPEPTEWFWDEFVTDTPTAPVVDDILGVEVSSADPAAQAAQWAALFGVEIESGDNPRITLGTRTITFVAGERRFLSAIDLKKVDGVDAPTELVVSGVTLRLR